MDYLLEQKHNDLKRILSDYGRLAIAFSGGVDSTLLAYIAHEILADNLLCVTISDEFHSLSEIQEAREFTTAYGIKHIVIVTDYINSEIFKKNERDRCYHCKKQVFGKIIEKAREKDFDIIADGTNADDIFDYRPGMKALKELGIKSPLKEAALNKKDIYKLAKKFNLKIKDKPSLACLATRIPFGEAVTKDKVRMIDEAEGYIRNLGFYDVRVRYYEKTAKIEIGVSDFKKLGTDIFNDINNKLKDIGFKSVYLDLDGYRKGSMNNG